MKKPRAATIKRESQETSVSLELKLDGSGQQQISTGIKMLDHLLSQMTQHGRFDLIIKASGDDQHHVAEDVAICLGKALGEALGDKRSILRMGDAAVPMDDSMAAVAVDISGRGYTVLDLAFADNDMLGFATDLIRHFLESLAIEGRLNLHARILYGNNDHHKAEALFKALGRALDIATRVDERLAGKLPTTKGILEE
jgi:imidazoleglycerol-phosphate dehydratase